MIELKDKITLEIDGETYVMPSGLKRTTYKDFKFPALIKLKRQSKCLTRIELAIILGVSVSTIGKWEEGQTRPTYLNCKKLSAILGGNPRQYRL